MENQYSIWLSLTEEAKRDQSMNIILGSLFRILDNLIEKIPEIDKKIELIEFNLLSNNVESSKNIPKQFQLLVNYYNHHPELPATSFFDIYSKISQFADSNELKKALQQGIEIIFSRATTPKNSTIKWTSLYKTIIKIVKERPYSDALEKFFKHFIFRKDPFSDNAEAKEHLDRISHIAQLLCEEKDISFSEVENFVCSMYLVSQSAPFERLLPELLNQIPYNYP